MSRLDKVDKKIQPEPITSKDGREFLDSFNQGTRNVYEPGLGTFLLFYKSKYGKGSLEDFLDALEEDLQRSRRERKRVGRNILREFVRWMEKEKYAPKTVRAYVSAVQSLAAYYDLRISARYINLPTSQPVSQKFPWTVGKVAEFVAMLPTVELQSIAVTTFQSGLGPADILGLTWNDIKYEYEHHKVPLCFDFSRKKTDVPFMTFIGKWGESLLRKHLKGKTLGLSDEIYSVSHRMISHHFKKLGEKWMGNYQGLNPCRLYSLRAAFRTLLSDENVDPQYIEFWMGHRAPEQRRVYISKSREGWRKTYAQYEYALTPERAG